MFNAFRTHGMHASSSPYKLHDRQIELKNHWITFLTVYLNNPNNLQEHKNKVADTSALHEISRD